MNREADKQERPLLRIANRLLSRLYARLPARAERAARAWEGSAGELPLTALSVPLGRARIALVTAGGVHRNDQPPFDMSNPDGDASLRVLPSPSDLSELTITHDYYDHQAADRDVNVVFPLERLAELARDGMIGEVAPRHVGVMGHLLGPERDKLVRETAPAIAKLFLDDGVHAVVLVPG